MRDVLLESGVTVVDPLGLHARPAAELVRFAESFKCDIWLEKDGLQVNAKSIMGVLTLAAEKGSQSYLGTVVIRQLGRDGFTIYEVQLEDAFPSVLGAVSLDMASSAIETFDVTFTYRTWYSSYANAPSSSYLGGLFKKHSRRIGSKIRRKIEDKVFG